MNCRLAVVLETVNTLRVRNGGGGAQALDGCDDAMARATSIFVQHPQIQRLLQDSYFFLGEGKRKRTVPALWKNAELAKSYMYQPQSSRVSASGCFEAALALAVIAAGRRLLALEEKNSEKGISVIDDSGFFVSARRERGVSLGSCARKVCGCIRRGDR